MYKKNQCAIVQKRPKFMTKRKKRIWFLCLSYTYVSLNKIAGAVFEKIETENLSHCKSYKILELPVLHNLRLSPPTEGGRAEQKVCEHTSHGFPK